MFWGLTPWQFNICIKASVEKEIRERDHSAWVMWHGAALARSTAKKLPDLSIFMSKTADKVESENKKSGSKVNEGAILAWLTSAKMARDAKAAQEKEKEQS